MITLNQLQRLAERRQVNWATYPKVDAGVSVGLTKRLDDGWAELRLQRARSRHGETATIVKRARVERELERLASTNHGTGGR